MVELYVGKPIEQIQAQRYEQALFHGMSLIEKRNYSLVVLNLSELCLEQDEIERIFLLLAKKSTPALIISSDGRMTEYDKLEYVEVIGEDLIDELFDDSIAKLKKLTAIDKQITNLSKQRRTLPFYVLSAFLLLEPIIKTIYLKIHTSFSFETVMGIVLSIESPVKVFEYWLLFPLAGFALARTAWWSLFVFLGTHVYSLYAHIFYDEFSWPYVQKSPHISSNLLLFLNTALLLYFLIPENRKPFIRKTKEIFRGSERRSLNQMACIKVGERQFDAELRDISETGVLITSLESLELDECVEVLLDTPSGYRWINAVVVRSVGSDGRFKSFGLRFSFKKRSQRKSVRSIIREIEAA
ncbi:MAG: PilZ domain-containing protein [Bacteriovoracaceae bacterium]|nr:PilZ domain-containing protein [Bacteriovoracaceae bacterium]